MMTSPDVMAQVIAHADLALQSLCRQIAADYLSFIKTHVIKHVKGCRDINVRELMVLLLIDATAQKIMRSHQLATAMRVNAATISRSVYALVTKGYLVSEDDVYDSRSRVYMLTEKSKIILENYRARCLEAIEEANARLHITKEDHDAIIQTGYETLYRLKDRAAAFKGVNFKARQRFRSGQGRARPAQTPSDDHLYLYADYVFRIFADQISSDYLVFIKKHIVKKMNKVQKLAIRDIRVLMAIDFFMAPITASDVAKLMSVEPATMSRGVTVLMKMGLIEGRDNFEDGRSKLLQTTAAGKDYAEKYKALSREKISQAEAHLGFSWDEEDRRKALLGLREIKARSAALAGLKRRKRRRLTMTDAQAEILRSEANNPELTGFDTVLSGNPD